MPNMLAVELPFGIEPEEARLLLSMKLFEEGKLSLGHAAEMAGYSKTAYRELLSKRGVPVFNYTVEEFEAELETLDALHEELAAERGSASGSSTREP